MKTGGEPMRGSRRHVLGATLLALVLFAGACGSGEDDSDDTGATGGEDRGSVTVGSDSFPEAQIVGEMYAQVLEAAGFEVERQLSIDTREVRLPAMESGDINVAPEYLASLLSVLDAESTPSGDPAEVADALEPLLEEKGLELLEFSDALDTNAFVVTQETADELGLVTMSDVGEVADELILGAPAECPERPFCIPGLKEVYGAEFADFKPLEYGAATAQALNAGAVDIALLFSTDPLIEAEGFVLLEDDQALQAADYITPLVTSDVADDVAEFLNAVSAALETDIMTELNKRVAIDAEDPADVAREFLEENDLI
jgi:osmoprotectant transport system substrate-binding protein